VAYDQNTRYLFPDNTARRCTFTAGGSVTLKGIIAGGPFTIGETVTGSVSATTAIVRSQTANSITVDTVVGVTMNKFDPTDSVNGFVSHAVIGSPVVITNIFGPWGEIVDDLGVKLSVVNSSAPIILDEINAADYSGTVARYITEVAYGASKIVVARHRFVSADWSAYPMSFFMPLKSVQVPKGELIYYRTMCEEALATVDKNFRYYYAPI
jgi:hypothetical protein